MARRIRWQIVIAVASSLLVFALMARLALSNTSVASPLAGGTIIEAVVGAAPLQPIPLLNDPLADPAGRDLGALLFDGLTRIGPDGLPELALAEDVQIDPSGEVYTFRLRQDVTWHDGQPLSADDVVFTLRAIQDINFAGDPLLARFWADVLIDRIDEYTVRCTLQAPYAPFLSLARVAVLPAHLLGTVPVDQWASPPNPRELVGTGPFKLVELTEQRARLEANPSYLGGRPFIDRIELRYFATPEAALSALSRGEVQALGADADSLGQLNLARTMRPTAIPLDDYSVLTFNLREEPLRELPLRQALARALDKDDLTARAVGSRGARLDTPILPGWWAYDPTASWYAYDPAAAQRMLSELSYEPGADGVRARAGSPLALELITDAEPARLAAAQTIAGQWGAVGVRVEVVQLDGATLRQRLRDHQFTLALHGWTRLGPDPNPFELWHSSRADEGLNYAGLADEQIDALLEGAQAEVELAARADDYAAFQRRWIELTPSIILYQPLYTFIHDQQLGGSGLEGDESTGAPPLLVGREDRYRNVMRWFINSSREIRGTLEQ